VDQVLELEVSICLIAQKNALLRSEWQWLAGLPRLVTRQLQVFLLMVRCLSSLSLAAGQ